MYEKNVVYGYSQVARNHALMNWKLVYVHFFLYNLIYFLFHHTSFSCIDISSDNWLSGKIWTPISLLIMKGIVVNVAFKVFHQSGFFRLLFKLFECSRETD